MVELPQSTISPKVHSKHEVGQVMVLICLAIIAIMGLIGVVVDVGFLQQQRNRMQTAADSAALAGAQEVSYGDMVAAGIADATSNGFTNGQNSVTVAINSPPTLGPNAGKSGFVESIVATSEPTYFLQVLGYKNISVSARAVAAVNSSPNCVYVMDPSASGALSITGNITIQTGCGFLVDSSSSSGLLANGNIAMTASTIGLTGGYSSTGNVSFTPTPKTGIAAAVDPLSYVQAPAVGSCAHTSYTLSGNTGSASSPKKLTPGVYCGGITVSGNSWLTFNTGTFILAGGGLQIVGNSVMTGTGVTFYNTTGTGGYRGISITGNSTMNFSAPTTGTLAGILFFQDRTVASSGAASSIIGNSSSTFDGAFYFPTTALTYSGNSSTSGYSIVVADKFTLTGNAAIGNNYSSLSGGSPIKATVLSE